MYSEDTMSAPLSYFLGSVHARMDGRTDERCLSAAKEEPLRLSWRVRSFSFVSCSELRDTNAFDAGLVIIHKCSVLFGMFEFRSHMEHISMSFHRSG